jgi:DNA-binding transcriptional ArsR family regulator
MNTEPLHILQNSRRRALLKILMDLGGDASLREVVRRITRLEGSDYDKGLSKSIHISMLQTHLPKLESAGIVKYDECSGTIRLHEVPGEVNYFLEVIENRDIPWSAYYLILSILSFTISLLIRDLYALILSGCFVIASMVHTYQTHSIVNESLTNVKRKLTKYIPSDNGKRR